MPSTPLTAAALAFLLGPGARAATLEVAWTIPADRQPYAPLSGTVGDVVRFDYGLGHNVVLHPTGSCDASGGTHLGSAGPTTYAFDAAGTYTFACDVSEGVHCQLGQIINITIADAASPESEGGGEEPAAEEAEEGENELAEAEGGGEGEVDPAEDQGQGEAEEATEAEEEEEEEGPNAEEAKDVPAADKGEGLPVAEEGLEEELAKYSEFFNPGEEMRLLELRIKPYQIPHRTTTYVDFLFNLPDDLGELVHVVVGDVVISQPKHLHHFVLTGCADPVDPDQEGLPQPFVRNCGVPLGGGWASGGDFFGGIPADAGAVLGTGLGIRSLSLNVHYTDGDEIDPALPNDGTHALATDGIRLLYTPDFRPRTILYKPVINVGAGPRRMSIPPAAPRQFYTKTCTVEPACLDTSDARMAAMDVDFVCKDVAGRCDVDDPAESLYYQILCPVSCGACDGRDRRDGEAPAGYQIDAVNYHAHLLGREMYTTLLPKAGSVPVDLASQELWIYDYQVTYPFPAAGDAGPSLAVYPGDKIQATCVYDSTEREETTIFSLSTYDEMCITQLSVLVDTPAAGADGGVSLLARLHAQSFNCAVDDDSDIWGGMLGPDEDGRDIWRDHPAADADCTFPVGNSFGQGLSLSGDVLPTYEARCKTDGGGGTTMCDGDDVFDGAAIAGENQQGGVSMPYTCQQAEDMVLNGPLGDAMGPETVKNLHAGWQLKCCAAGDRVEMCAGLGAGTVHDEDAVAGEECTGGSLDGVDSNDASSYEAEGDVAFAELCIAGGGTSQSYTCAEVETYYLNGSPTEASGEELELVRTQVFQPKCCIDGEGLGDVPKEISGDDADGETGDVLKEISGDDADGETGDVPKEISGDDAGGETDAVPPCTGSSCAQEQDGVVPGEVSNAAIDGAEPSSSFASSPSLLFILPAIAFFVGTL